MTRFLTRLFGVSVPTVSKPIRRVSLCVETLESRATPSGTRIMYKDIHNASAHNDADHGSDRVIKRIEKLHALTAKNLAPGSYR